MSEAIGFFWLSSYLFFSRDFMEIAPFFNIMKSTLSKKVITHNLHQFLFFIHFYRYANFSNKMNMKCCRSITLSNTLCKKVYLVSFDECSYEDELNIKIDRAIYCGFHRRAFWTSCLQTMASNKHTRITSARRRWPELRKG